MEAIARAADSKCQWSVGEVGVIGCAVGAPFAVLVAEQLFASGCQLFVSVTSAGQITNDGPPPYFVLIDRALRDEGTSYHYLPPATFAEAPDAALFARVEEASLGHPGIAVRRGATWTTDAPYRETEAAIVSARESGALAVEMEAAGRGPVRLRDRVGSFGHLLCACDECYGADRGGFRER